MQATLMLRFVSFPHQTTSAAALEKITMESDRSPSYCNHSLPTEAPLQGPHMPTCVRD